MLLEASSPRRWWKQKAADTWSGAPVWLNTSLHPLLHLDNRYQLLMCSEAFWSPVSQIRHALNQKLLDIFKNWMTRVTVEISQVQSNTGGTTVWCLNSDIKKHHLCCSQQPTVIVSTGAPEGSIPQTQPVTGDVLLRRGVTLQSQQCSLSDACISETIIKAVSLNRNRSQGQEIRYFGGKLIDFVDRLRNHFSGQMGHFNVIMW